MRSMVCWTAQLTSRPRRVGLRRTRLCASSSRQRSISARNSSSTSAVPRLPAFASANLSSAPCHTAALAKTPAISSQRVGVLPVVQQEDAPRGGLVRGCGLGSAVVDGELLEIGEDGEGQLGAPRIAAELVGGLDVVLDVDRGLLGLDEELALLADAEGVIRRLGRAADFDLVLVDDLFVLLGEALHVVDVPAER